MDEKDKKNQPKYYNDAAKGYNSKYLNKNDLVQLTMWVSREDRERHKKNAKDNGLSTSAYLKRAVLISDIFFRQRTDKAARLDFLECLQEAVNQDILNNRPVSEEDERLELSWQLKEEIEVLKWEVENQETEAEE